MTFSTGLLELIKCCFLICLAALTSVLGCGTLPQGEVTAVRFTASGFTLPAIMAYSEATAVHTVAPNISRNRDSPKNFVRNLIMNAVNDILQEQGRNALLPDAVVSLILQQLNVSIEYTPLECKTATTNPMNAQAPNIAMADGCFIIEGEVKSLCMANGCMLSTGVMVMPLPTVHRTITGSLRTSNIVMANWSTQMWQSVLNRMYQRLATGSFGKYFSTAIITVSR